MNAASQEYLYTFETLKEELNSFKTQQNELKFQISRLFDENKRLTNELKENIIKQEQQLSDNGYHELEQKWKSALASKNAAIEMWQEALQQLEKQEELLIGKRSIIETERSESELLVLKVKEEYVKGLNVLSAEVNNYRSELLSRTQELQSTSAELESCKGVLESRNNELHVNQQTVIELTLQKREMEEKISTLQALLSETESFLSTTKKEMASMKSENLELSVLSAELKDENQKLKNKVAVFEKDAKESLITAQEAILKKKEMAYREEQYLKDIEHLKSSISIESEKISLKYKAELKEIQKQFTLKIENLMKEIQTLHEENSDKQSLFEKAVREKQALESKLELLYSEFSNGNPSSMTALDDLCKRLTISERAKDELEYRVRSLETDLQELKLGKDQEIKCVLNENTALKDRLSAVVEDFNQSSSERIKLSDEVTRLKKRSYEVEKELKLTRTRLNSEIVSTKEEAQQKQQSLINQFKSSEEHYKKVCAELQKLLEAEFKISCCWKEEVDDLIVKSESKIKELCQMIVQLQGENKELIGALGHNNTYVSSL